MKQKVATYSALFLFFRRCVHIVYNLSPDLSWAAVLFMQNYDLRNTMSSWSKDNASGITEINPGFSHPQKVHEYMSSEATFFPRTTAAVLYEYFMR
jgi:hypothetical protein